jgi:hypothetical protein
METNEWQDESEYRSTPRSRPTLANLNFQWMADDACKVGLNSRFAE